MIPEAPRYYTIKGKHERAEQALSSLRGLDSTHPYVQAEIIGIRNQLEREREATHGVSRRGKVRELLLVPANRYRFMLGLMSQVLSQWYLAPTQSLLSSSASSESRASRRSCLQAAFSALSNWSLPTSVHSS